MSGNQVITAVLREQAQETPEAVAILAQDRPSLTFRALLHQIERVAAFLNAQGISRNDRVAVVLPNGPEMATAFLGVASCATSAPLNPAYRSSEFEYYLSDLNAKALLVQRDIETPAREAASTIGIPVFDVVIEKENEAGFFSFSGDDGEPRNETVYSDFDDVALVLHTSGTTSKPKIVPLTQKNLCTSARHIKTTLQLTAKDRCLNVMPMFHIHGLMAALVSSLSAGASVVCSAGFDVDSFFDWLISFEPTWYTAVPTMQQTILDKVQANPDLVEGNTLRFLRSSSASLPKQAMEGLEAAFGAPMIESYGMTEAAHQMTSNPLPPLPRKAGTVGIEAGPNVRVMDAAGNILRAGEPGEIVIQGENVFPGYENNPAANEAAFTNGWFRTGDEGVIGEDGFLTITGRLKEMVNRGGEKVAPREVDEALLDHPEVAQAVAFAVAHPTLGEDLAAAVILNPESTVTERDLREFAFGKLADFKVPSQIVIVDEIPEGSTGKLQRIGLAEKLHSKLEKDYVAPSNTIEKTLVGIWETVLHRDRVGIHDNFFTLGGDSISAASVVRELEAFTGKKLELPVIFQAPTIEQIANILLSENSESDSYLIPIRPEGSQKPIFLVPGHGGDIFTYSYLARYLDSDYPLYVFRFPDAARLDNEVANKTILEMASQYVQEMIALQPDGPYKVLGFCFGGELAFEIAQQLRAKGKKTGLVGIIHVELPETYLGYRLKDRIASHWKNLRSGGFKNAATYVKSASVRLADRLSRRIFPSVSRRFVPAPPGRTYFPRYYPGRITLFQTKKLTGESDYYTYMGWKGLVAEAEVFSLPGNRFTTFVEPEVQILAKHLNSCLKDISE